MDPKIKDLLCQPTLTPAQTSVVLNTPRKSTYEAIARGEIQSFRVGKLIKVPTAPLKRKLGITDEQVAA